MHSHKTIGDYYAHLLHVHLHEAMQRKLDVTSPFKKLLAGIETIEDAQTKGYAPNNEQIHQMKDCIRQKANAKVMHMHFKGPDAQNATTELIEAVVTEITTLNDKWKEEKKFSFDNSALLELRYAAASLIESSHFQAVMQSG